MLVQKRKYIKFQSALLFFIYMNERKKWKIIFFHLTPSTHTYL